MLPSERATGVRALRLACVWVAESPVKRLFCDYRLGSFRLYWALALGLDRSACFHFLFARCDGVGMVDGTMGSSFGCRVR
ncbi:Tubulin beta [Fusarium oxysporum f. sp. albedinis]|nr:Tubulin beta [Fusarium oxysporum f. sp. albedinis]